MLLNLEQFTAECDRIHFKKGSVGFDFETTGLNPYKGARAFIMGWADETGRYSFRFSAEDEEEKHRIKVYCIARFFSNPALTYCAHNAKFELSFLSEQFNTYIDGTVWDTEAQARVAYDKPIDKSTRFGLQPCAERIGESKLREALDWLKANGKDDYTQMPMVVDYVEQDAWLSWRLRQHQVEIFKHWDISGEVPIKNVVRLETEVLKPLFEMERRGLLVNIPYCIEARHYERGLAQTAKEEFKKLTGVEFVDSAKTFKPIFDREGLKYGKAPKGGASFDAEVLEPQNGNNIVRSILGYRSATKRASTYWDNFIDFADQDGVIHPNINQNRAATGRMSVTEPACQTWPNDDDDPQDEGPFPIRRAFLARLDRFIVSLDFIQMELRLSADEAGDHLMIEAFNKGTDFHKLVAEMAHVPRSIAKPARFAKAYGAGDKKIAQTLGISLEEAKKVSQAIAATAPRCEAYAWELINYAQCAPYGYNFLGRRYYFDKGFEYKYPNYRIQGAGSEILKRAIIKVGRLLKNTDSWMLLPVHDELILDMPKSDFHLIPLIKQAMIESYRHKYLPMDVSVAIGKNMHDLETYNA